MTILATLISSPTSPCTVHEMIYQSFTFIHYWTRQSCHHSPPLMAWSISYDYEYHGQQLSWDEWWWRTIIMNIIMVNTPSRSKSHSQSLTTQPLTLLTHWVSHWVTDWLTVTESAGHSRHTVTFAHRTHSHWLWLAGTLTHMSLTH